MRKLMDAFIVALAAALGTAAGNAVAAKAKEKKTKTCPQCEGKGTVPA